MTHGVTVVVTAHQGAAVIGRALRSLLDQTLTPEQIVVVDDGSTDDTVEVIRSIARSWPDLVTLVSQSNEGVGGALRRGVREATSELVAIADQDDWFVPDRLECSVALLQETGADVVGGQVVGRLGRHLRFAPSRFPTDATGIRRRLAAGRDPLPHTTMLARRDAFDRFGPYRDVPRAADLELMLRWAHRGATFAVSPHVLAEYSFRPEFFSVGVQTRWMLLTQYGREIALLDDEEVPSFVQWFGGRPVGPARREAMVRVARLTARLGAGMVPGRHADVITTPDLARSQPLVGRAHDQHRASRRATQ